MKQPSHSNIDFRQLVQALPENYQGLAHELGAFLRARKVRSAEQLLQLILLYCGLDFSLRSSAAQFSQMQGYLSDTAVKNRLRKSVEWITALQKGVLQTEQVVLKGNLRLKAIDGSTVQVPGATGTSYRLHIAMNLNTLELAEVNVSTDKQGESLALYALEEGDVVVVDRGYNEPKGIVPFMDTGGSLILRYNPRGMKLFSQDEETCAEPGRSMHKIDWVKTLGEHDGKAHATPVYVQHQTVRVKGFVHAIPLPTEQAEQARRKLREKARKKGRTASADNLYLCGWVLIFSNLPLSVLDTQTASDIYRVRWQVELLIKRLKSVLDIDRLRAKKNSPLSELYLQGKLLYAALIEKLANVQFYANKRRQATCCMMETRTHTPWRVAVLIAAQVKAAIIAAMPCRHRHVTASLSALCERPRKRRLQSLPEPIVGLVNRCRKRGLSDV